MPNQTHIDFRVWAGPRGSPLAQMLGRAGDTRTQGPLALCWAEPEHIFFPLLVHLFPPFFLHFSLSTANDSRQRRTEGVLDMHSKATSVWHYPGSGHIKLPSTGPASARSAFDAPSTVTARARSAFDEPAHTRRPWSQRSHLMCQAPNVLDLKHHGAHVGLQRQLGCQWTMGRARAPVRAHSCSRAPDPWLNVRALRQIHWLRHTLGLSSM